MYGFSIQSKEIHCVSKSITDNQPWTPKRNSIENICQKYNTVKALESIELCN